MLEKLLRHLKNWFIVRDGIHSGQFTIKGGSIELPFLLSGQYFRIVGSVLNDGLYRYPVYTLVDETFNGAVWALAVPPDVVKLSEKIEQWLEKNPESPYASESFGGYSYTKASSPTTGQSVTWKDVFRADLNQWRKL